MDQQRLGASRAVDALFAGVGLSLGSGRLRRILLVSVLTNAVAYGLLVAGMITLGMTLTAHLVEDSAAAGIIAVFAALAIFAGTTLIAPVLFNLVSVIVMPIFRQRVFDAAREASGGRPVEAAGGIGATVAVLNTEVRRLLRFAVFSILVLPLNLVPVAGNLAYVILQFLIAAHTMAWDLMSFHFELHNLPFRDQKAWLKRNRLGSLTLGSFALVLCLIPFAQLLFLTTNVAGAGRMSARLDGESDQTV